MSTNDSIGVRIRSERERLGLSQAIAAQKMGVSRASQANYESGKRSADSDYLFALGELGADVGYVLFGERSTPNSLYSLAASWILPLIADRAKFNAGALLALLGLAAEDEALAWGTASGGTVPKKHFHQLVEALFENGALLESAFDCVRDELHESGIELSPDKKAAVILALYEDFKEMDQVDQRRVKALIKIAA